MDWKDLAGPVIKLGGTTIGALIGLPGLGKAGGEILAEALGVEPTPEAVGKAIEVATPDALAAVREADAKAQEKWAEFAIVQAQQTGDTMRAEISAGVSWWHWRHLLGYVVMLWALAILPVAIRDLWIGNAEGIDLGIKLATALTTYFLALCGLLGYVAMDTSRRTTAAASGAEIPTILGSIIKAVKR